MKSNFRHWLYGEKIELNEEDGLKNKVNKGWFPTKSVKIDEKCNLNQYTQSNHNNDGIKVEKQDKKEN